LQVQQNDVWTVLAKLVNRFAPVRRFAYQLHVGLIGHQTSDASS
jgi:hypothetical protein